jgi:hypothetical protein
MLSHAYRSWTPDDGDRAAVAARIVTHSGDKLGWEVSGDKVHLSLPWWDFEKRVLTEADSKTDQPRYSRMPIPYTLIPFRLRTTLNRARIHALRQQHQGENPFPADPVETSLDDFRRGMWVAASKLAGVEVAATASEKVLVLTHDLDESFGWAGVRQLRDVERDLGVVSAVGVLSKRYTLPEGHLEWLLDEGCEVYSHGYLHDGLLPYVPVEQLRARLGHFFDAYPSVANQVKGFRSGQLVRSPEMFEVVAEFFEYDMTPPTVELGGPHGWRTGCGTTTPFDGPKGLVHLPLTLPQDYFLRGVDRRGPDDIARVWSAVAERVWAAGGVAVHLVHPDNIVRWPDLLRAYQMFLVEALDAGASVRLPGQVITKRGTTA